MLLLLSVPDGGNSHAWPVCARAHACVRPHEEERGGGGATMVNQPASRKLLSTRKTFFLGDGTGDVDNAAALDITANGDGIPLAPTTWAMHGTRFAVVLAQAVLLTLVPAHKLVSPFGDAADAHIPIAAPTYRRSRVHGTAGTQRVNKGR